MSRFDAVAYDKLFPRPTNPPERVETPVDTFTPTKDKLEGVEKVEKPTEDATIFDDKAVEEKVEIVTEQGGDDDGS